MKGEKVNYSTKPVPTSPGAKLITHDNFVAKKGSADMSSKMPANVVPGPKSKTAK